MEDLSTVELSSEELSMFFNMINQMNENIQLLDNTDKSEELLEQVKLTNEYLETLVFPEPEPEPEPIEYELTEMYQLEMLNESMQALNESNQQTYTDDIATLNGTMQELTQSFSDYQEYHYSTNQLYQFSTLLIYPMAIVFIVYKIVKKFIIN